MIQQNADKPRLLTSKEFADLLRIGKTSFHGAISRGEIGPEPLRLNGGKGHPRYRRSEIDDWIESGTPNRDKWKKIYKKH